MREFHTAVLERFAALDPEHHTEPYECGWATEATFTVYVDCPGADVDLAVEVSADGRRWLPHGTGGRLLPDTVAARIPVRHFGGWLRLALRHRPTHNHSADRRFDIYVDLKE